MGFSKNPDWLTKRDLIKRLCYACRGVKGLFPKCYTATNVLFTAFDYFNAKVSLGTVCTVPFQKQPMCPHTNFPRSL